MVRSIDSLEAEKVAEGIAYVKSTWNFKKPCDDSVIEKGVKCALAIAKKIDEHGWEAIALIDGIDWDNPAPQLPSLEVFPDSFTVEEFAQNVCSQHVIFAYGDHVEALRDCCNMMDIELVM